MMEKKSMELSGWGGYPRVNADVIVPDTFSEAESAIDNTMIMRGQGRSYGDAAISKSGIVVLEDHLNQLMQLDEDGVLVAEAGSTIDQVLQASVSQGWFPPVVPGTRFVSLGGCIAADVHGKNHHRDGSFTTHVRDFEIILADRTREICSAKGNAELFWATAGGMGLTGMITKVSLAMRQIETPYVVVQQRQTANLDASLNVLSDATMDDEYSVVWIDCLAKRARLGRGIFMSAHHAKSEDLPEKLRLAHPKVRQQAVELKFDLPAGVLNRFSVAAFNEVYYRVQGLRAKRFIQHYDDFFFPLDKIGSWNRMYGRQGFIQYQCVLRREDGARGIQSLLEAVSRSNHASFLAVLKLFGKENEGPLSFPMEGYTITLDFPLRVPGLIPFLDRLDEIVLQFGGRVYLAKDARLRAETFRRMYSRLDQWLKVKTKVDPTNRFESNLARRLSLLAARQDEVRSAG